MFEVVGGTVEVEGPAVRRVTCVAEAAFEGAVFYYVGRFDGDAFNGSDPGGRVISYEA